MKFRRKPQEIEATQWFKGGDHKRVHHSNGPETIFCYKCERPGAMHGIIHSPNGTYLVCPGDWIITVGEKECRPCKPDAFTRLYERVEDES